MIYSVIKKLEMYYMYMHDYKIFGLNSENNFHRLSILSSLSFSQDKQDKNIFARLRVGT